ncbi:hypothetical protein M407DRAFT_84872 [Tulasnella calospora MUT 4182]|uniref:Retrotransposon gag domain-containing protein n=1 Tax=Tulasnella calospora MUT 4182 TaxID=1051891 RepID=A0A0C3Q461_9AGAM|nr:hypothetical protein M407DRAFT_84872 [Tulasnella calospora MUT 4182]
MLAQSNTLRVSNWSSFKGEFEQAFFDQDEKRVAAQKLNKLCQNRSTAEYASEFRELVAILGWTEDSQLQHAFYDGLKPHVKDELAKMDDPVNLVTLITTAIKIDNRHWSREQEKKGETTPVPTSQAPNDFAHTTPVPMQIDAARRGPISQAEKDRRRKEGLCHYCGEKGHMAKDHNLPQRRTNLSANNPWAPKNLIPEPVVAAVQETNPFAQFMAAIVASQNQSSQGFPPSAS